jgi:hypothetical protein
VRQFSAIFDRHHLRLVLGYVRATPICSPGVRLTLPISVEIFPDLIG